MTSFSELVQASEEDLVRTFHVFRPTPGKRPATPAAIAAELQLNAGQLMCALGFNRNAPTVGELITVLGFQRFAEIEEKRNQYFAKDIYKRLSLDDVLSIYEVIKDQPRMLHTMQYLLQHRLRAIEQHIESTINSVIIEKYKAEIRAVYCGSIATIEFAEERLKQVNSGFRSLANEVDIIIDSKLIPVGEVFFMETILPEEKRRLLEKGLIPDELVITRLRDRSIPRAESRILREYLKQQKRYGAG